jgi:hypothetical protein
VYPCLFIIYLSAATPSWAQHQHAGDVIIGRSSAGQLKIEADLDEPHLLDAVNGLLKGFAGEEPGFEALTADEPAEDFFMLAPGADIRLEGISLDAALKAHDHLNPLLVIDSAGDQLTLGAFDLHNHVVWHADSLDPAFDPLATEWQGTFRLVDVGTTLYAPSDAFTIRFTNVPEPAAITLLAFGLSALMRRKRMPGGEAA